MQRSRECVQSARSALLSIAAASLALVLSYLASAGVARAQNNPQQLAEANRRAMEAYNNLDVERAKATLEKAAQSAEKNGIRGPALARTYANLAVVLVGGLGDQAGAVEAFRRALKEDPKVEPDPLVATPEVTAAFNAAQSGARRSEPVVESAPEPEPAPPPRRDPSEPIEGNLQHEPALEQLTQTGVPVFVKKSPELEDADSVKVFYRSLGMQKPKSADLQEGEDGYSYIIPCADVFEPVVEYFIVAVDDDGNQIGNAGTPAKPIAIPIVTTRSGPAPSLPGMPPPRTCSADTECPPGMPGCSGNAGLGETCSQDSDCQSGLICSDDFCTTGEREERDDRSGHGGAKRFFMDLNFGLGLTYVGEGRAPDHTVPRAVFDTAQDIATVDQMVDIERLDQELIERGWDCDTNFVLDPDMRTVPSIQNCKVAVKAPGFVAVPILYLAAGYYITPRFALALTGRIQFARGVGPLAGIMVGARGEYLLTKPAKKGFRAGLLAGAAVGQIQAQPPVSEGENQGPYATNANLGGVGVGVTVGGRIGYRFIPNLGINLTPAVNLAFPNLLFAFDVTGGLEVAF